MIIGIVGSRKMSEYGKIVVSKLVKSILEKNFKMVTGRVRGVNNWVIEVGGDAVEVIETKDFEMMNREIAKRCDKLIVIEGGENSGTFLVAQLVLEMGKEVWAVPGRITDEGSAAPN
ncbi:MAG: DNA-processing protein DprA, partial [Candidatus Shapirobacteria bacterium]|nr:DNA-processing protein DprA [Candidatus Shapirobacteria bacterium]